MTQLLTYAEVAEMLRVSERTVRNLVADARLHAKHVGRRAFVTDTEVERYKLTLDSPRRR